jgi:serine/threonine-protein kinase ATR
MLLDHLSKWARLTRKHLSVKKSDAKRARGSGLGASEQLTRIDSVLSSIDQDLMAKAAFQCKAYARSLMSFERHLASLQERNANDVEIQSCYERLHEIYCHLDEPDGMEGISTLILSPTLEHQIRQHESTGRWTSAQSCWELRLQQSPDNLDYHIGLLRCLRNLGHYGQHFVPWDGSQLTHYQTRYEHMLKVCSLAIQTGSRLSSVSKSRVPG